MLYCNSLYGSLRAVLTTELPGVAMLYFNSLYGSLRAVLTTELPGVAMLYCNSLYGSLKAVLITPAVKYLELVGTGSAYRQFFK